VVLTIVMDTREALGEHRTRLYEDGAVLAEGFDPYEITELLRAHPRAVLWLDLLDPDEKDLEAVAAEFRLHPLAVEDAVHDHQRPKVDGLLDVIVDGHYAAASRLDEAMDRTEDAILAEGRAPRPVRRYGFALRRTLAELRRPVAPMPELIAELIRRDGHLLGEHLEPYYRDVDDHARRATETIDHARERINGLLEADLNEQSNALNDVTRKLAAWAAIIAVPTALTGYFGQNVPYPGYERVWGFLLSLALIAGSAAGLYLYLRRRGWL
jgi:Mg2+ and Co2+ transporter CorA